MKRILNVLEVLGLVEAQGNNYELCASADATLDQDAHKLHVRLQSHLRPVHAAQPPATIPSWLPREENLIENSNEEEALDLARDIFRRWARKTREKAPALHQPA